MDWKAIQIVLGDGAIFVLNGFLATAYWLYGQAPLLATLPAVLWTLHFDRSAWRQAGFRSRRYDRGTVIRAGHSAALWTLAAASVWLAAALLSASPVPAIGAAMWWGMALGKIRQRLLRNRGWGRDPRVEAVITGQGGEVIWVGVMKDDLRHRVDRSTFLTYRQKVTSQ